MTPAFFYVMLQLLYCAVLANIETLDWTKEAIVWLESNSDSIFVYKLVSLAINVPKKGKKDIIAPGVFINSNRVLTSFNPFRKFYPRYLGNVTATVFVGRKTNNSYTFDVKPFHIECSRQVVYVQGNETLPEDQENSDTKYSPVDDLMVLTLNKNISDLKTFQSYEQFGKVCVDNVTNYKRVGGFKSDIALSKEPMGDAVKWTSMFLDNFSEMNIYKVNESQYSRDVNVVDCRGWVPFDWGNFICVLNVYKYSELVSGSIITSNDKVYGIGSFALFKDNQSVLVFTDVRPYEKMIMNACAVQSLDLTESTSLALPIGH